MSTLNILEKNHLDWYLRDCEEYYDSIPVETYTTYYNHARSVLEDYTLWLTNREQWIKEAKS